MPRGLTRLPTLLVTAALAALLAGGCADEAAAAHVGDTVISDDELLEEAEAVESNTEFWALIDEQNGQEEGTTRQSLEGDAPDSFSQQFMAGVLQQRITFVLVDQMFEDEGAELTDDDRAAAIQSLEGQYGPSYQGFPEDYRDLLIRDSARLNSLQRSLGEEGFNEAFSEKVQSTEIDISSRYGTWDSERFRASPGDVAIAPPTGSTPAPGAAPEVEL